MAQPAPQRDIRIISCRSRIAAHLDRSRPLASGTLRRYIQEFSVTGLTSNPTIFDHALRNSNDYDDEVRQKLKESKSGEGLFFELAIEDLRQAADLFWSIHDAVLDRRSG